SREKLVRSSPGVLRAVEVEDAESRIRTCGVARPRALRCNRRTYGMVAAQAERARSRAWREIRSSCGGCDNFTTTLPRMPRSRGSRWSMETPGYADRHRGRAPRDDVLPGAL